MAAVRQGGARGPLAVLDLSVLLRAKCNRDFWGAWGGSTLDIWSLGSEDTGSAGARRCWFGASQAVRAEELGANFLKTSPCRDSEQPVPVHLPAGAPGAAVAGAGSKRQLHPWGKVSPNGGNGAGINQADPQGPGTRHKHQKPGVPFTSWIVSQHHRIPSDGRAGWQTPSSSSSTLLLLHPGDGRKKGMGKRREQR